MSDKRIWLSIDNDGQPKNIGWFDVLYEWDDWDSTPKYCFYFDGTDWLYCKGGRKTIFGNSETEGERYSEQVSHD